MADTTRIQEHMEVVGSDGQHVGTVDHVEGDQIKLTRKDPAAGGQHHYLSADRVRTVSDRVELDCPADEARRSWRTESGARGGSSGSGRDAGGMR